MEVKKNMLSAQPNVEAFVPDDFEPASAEEKQSLVIMRESVGFWKDGFRRFKKNRIAMTALAFVLLVVYVAATGMVGM